MNKDEFITELNAKLMKFRVPKDYEWLLDHLDKMIADYERRYEINKGYVKANKKKIYKYNIEYRRKKKNA
jgi:uncharacterized membrane protein